MSTTDSGTCSAKVVVPSSRIQRMAVVAIRIPVAIGGESNRNCIILRHNTTVGFMVCKTMKLRGGMRDRGGPVGPCRTTLRTEREGCAGSCTSGVGIAQTPNLNNTSSADCCFVISDVGVLESDNRRELPSVFAQKTVMVCKNAGCEAILAIYDRHHISTDWSPLETWLDRKMQVCF